MQSRLRGHLDEVSEFLDLNSLMRLHMSGSISWLKTSNKSSKVSHLMYQLFSPDMIDTVWCCRVVIYVKSEIKATFIYSTPSAKSAWYNNNIHYSFIRLIHVTPLCLKRPRKEGHPTDLVSFLGYFYNNWPTMTNANLNLQPCLNLVDWVS